MIEDYKKLINDVKESIAILDYLKEKYEQYHKIKYTCGAIESCVYLSDRYITDKRLPDKIHY